MLLSEFGITKRTQNALAKKHIQTTDDIVKIYPRAYHDFKEIHPIQYADANVFCAFAGKLVYCNRRQQAKPYLVLKIIQDDGLSFSVIMFNELYRYEDFLSLKGQKVVIYGKADYSEEYGWSVKSPYHLHSFETFKPHIEPVYTKIQGVSEEMFHDLLQKSISIQNEPLEDEILSKYKLMPFKKAIELIHKPYSLSQLSAAKYRMLFNDLLYFALSLNLHKEIKESTAIQLSKTDLMKQFIESLPYSLTTDQNEVLSHFLSSVTNGKKFNALVQGDVGCGKTVVAIAMAVCTCENGYQSVLTAPREVLAKQHYEEVNHYAKELGLNTVFLHSGMNAKEKRTALEQVKTGEANIIVGTHSCFSDSVQYHNLGLVITDEEHLFGVKQKECLQMRTADIHSVSMSATPIPRSLATILYANKSEILTIHSMPPGRKPVMTATQMTHKNVFPFMEKQIHEGHQCYVVCPAIEENDEYGIVAIETVEQEYRDYFEPRGIHIGIVNGKMDKKQIESTISGYINNDIQILISTTVIEVGVNVPNATVMVVEQAERFGLASLHQLRGRVGRSSTQSYCILISLQKDNPRLKTMVETTDGFKIAEADLSQRGSGDLLGIRQAGHNRFVDEMLNNPFVFQRAVQAAKDCARFGCGEKLKEYYGDAAESLGEEAS